MVVRDATGQANTGTDQEVAHDSLETRLSRFEIRAGDQGAFTLGILDDSWVERVLWGSVQIEALLFNGSDAVEDGGRQWGVVLHALQEVVNSVDLGEEEHLRVSCPQDDDLVSSLFHSADVCLQFVDQLTVGSCKQIGSTVRLVGRNVVWVERCRKRRDLLKLWAKLLEQGGLEDRSALGSFVQVGVADVPSADLHVDRVDGREQVLDVAMHILQLTRLLIKFESNVSSCALSEGTVEVCSLLTILCGPGHVALVGEDTGDKRGSIVATETDEHNTESGHTLVSLDDLGLGNCARHLLLLVVQGEPVLVRHGDLILRLDSVNAWSGALWLRLESELTVLGGGGDDLVGWLDHLNLMKGVLRVFFILF